MDDISLKNIEKQILAFNNDPRVFALRNRYTTKTFLDIMSVARSENRHSAFLAWLLEGNDFAVAPQDHPIVHLMDCIIKRVQDQGIKVPDNKIGEGEPNSKIDDFDSLKKIILTRNIKSIRIKEVKPEKVLGVLCEGVKGIPEQDRIDIYIRCSIKTKDNEEYPIEFIIENKIGSTEGKKPSKKSKNYENISSEYKEKWQTERYFEACSARKNNKPKYSIFAYLTPASNNELESLYDKNISHSEEDENKKPTSPYFFHINYQDVLDNIIEPLLVPEANISDRIRLFLEEYISALSLPAYEQNDNAEENTQQIKNAIIMAVRTEEKKQLLDLWTNSHNGFSELLKRAIKAYNEPNGDDTLKQFCEVNKALIIAILRVTVESNPTEETLLRAYKDLIKSKHDYSTFDIFTTDNNSDEPTVSLGKGQMFLWIVKRWTEKLPNNNIVETLAGLTQDNIISANDYKAKKEKKPDIEKRYFKQEDSISIDDQTYYLSNQWGIGDRLNFWLDFLGFDFKQFNDAVNGDTYTKEYSIEQVKQNRDGEKLMRDLGIKSITWTKIMK